jgi:hypothetical protein
MAINPNTTFSAGAILTAAQMNRLPWGVVAFADKTADQTGIGAGPVDVTGLSVTWTAVSTRYYRVSVYLAPIRQRTAAGIVVPVITDGSNNVKTQANVSLGIDGFTSMVIADIETGLSGSTTRKLRIGTTAGTVEVLAATAGEGNYIVVEDLGEA